MSWFAEIPKQWRAIVAIAAILATGAMFGGRLTALRAAEPRITKLEYRTDTLAMRLDALGGDILAMRQMNEVALCLQLTEKTGDNWRQCLLDLPASVRLPVRRGPNAH